MRELRCLQFASRVERDAYLSALNARHLPEINAREIANPSPFIPEHLRILTTQIVGVVDDVTCQAPDERFADAKPTEATAVRVRLEYDAQQGREAEVRREPITVQAEGPVRDGDTGVGR